jgi:hypothetical protein
VWRRLRRVEWREWGLFLGFLALGIAVTAGEYALGLLDWVWDVHDSPDDNGAIGLLGWTAGTQGFMLFVLSRSWKPKTRIVTSGITAFGTLLLLVEARAGWHDWFLAHEWSRGGILLPLFLVWAAHALPLLVVGAITWELVAGED